MEISIIGMIVAATLWLTALITQLIRVDVPSSLSEYELQRRAKDGDVTAQDTLLHRKYQPMLSGFISISRYATVVCATAATVGSTSLFVGLPMSIFAAGVVLMLSRYTPAVSFINKQWSQYKTFQQRLSNWHWLRLFAPQSGNYEQYTVASEQELEMMITTAAPTLSKQLRTRLVSALRFESKKVDEVMMPVSVVETIGVKDSLGPLILDGLHKTGHSRFPVVDGDINHIVGMLYLHDVVELRSAKAMVIDAMDPRVYFIRQDQTLTHALHGFLRTHHHLFIVVNEYRETVGVLSLEDVLESLIGYSITDEFDTFDDLRAVAAKNPHHNNEPKGMNNI